MLDIADGVFEVLSTNGDTHLGGEDFDNRIVNHFLEEFKKEEGIDLKNDSAAMQRLKDEAEKAKKELSSTTSYEVNLPFLTADEDGPKHFEYTLTRAKLEELVTDLIERLADPVEKALKDADLKASDIVAVGAAIQGGVLAGDVKDVLLLDVTPLTLGIETAGGVRTPMIDRNTTVPTSKSQVFSTYADNQPQVEIHVLQGEREMATDNKSLGMFVLSGIAPAPRGVPQIEVTFNIDANGILTVTAKDKGTGKENNITIQNSGNMSKEDIEKAEDKKKREIIDAKNQLENAIYQAEKMPSEFKDKISKEDEEAISKAVEEAKKHQNSEDKDELEKASKDLQDAIMPIGAKLYQAQSAEASDAKESGKKDDEPVEGEVIDKK